MVLYKVKNKFNDVRKFHEMASGNDILVEPGQSVVTSCPPEASALWEVSKVEEKEKKINKPKKEKPMEDDE